MFQREEEVLEQLMAGAPFESAAEARSALQATLAALRAALTDDEVAINGRVQVQPTLPVAMTVDHRYVDAAQLRQAVEVFRAYLADPAAFEPSVERAVAEARTDGSN